MASPSVELTIGVEEELFLVNKNTGALSEKGPEPLWDICHKAFPDQIIHEFLSGQVELVSKPAETITQLHEDAYQLRAFLIHACQPFDLTAMASSTHPTALWRDQKTTPSTRYEKLSDELKISTDRMLVCGTHIHIGVSDRKQRLRLYNELIYFLPLILSLTTSSPFWAGHDTGMQSYRATIVNGLPRAGLPPTFCDIDAYQRYLCHMIDAGAISSAKDLWWDVRLSANFPTVEVRIGDTCTDLEDLMAVAAFVQSLSRYLLSGSEIDKSLLDIRHLCTKENRWRAQRYSQAKNVFLVTGSKTLQKADLVLDAMLEHLWPHAIALGCVEYLQHCKHIYRRGTSADLQRARFAKAIKAGESIEDALQIVSQHLIAQTAVLRNPMKYTELQKE